MLYCWAPATGEIVHVNDLRGRNGRDVSGRGRSDALAEEVQGGNPDQEVVGEVVIAVSFEAGGPGGRR